MRSCKYSGEPEYWVEVLETGEKGQERESKKQRKEISQDTLVVLVGIQLLKSRQAASHSRVTNAFAVWKQRPTTIIQISSAQDTDKTPLAPVSTAAIDKTTARTKASQGIGAVSTSEAIDFQEWSTESIKHNMSKGGTKSLQFSLQSNIHMVYGKFMYVDHSVGNPWQVCLVEVLRKHSHKDSKDPIFGCGLEEEL